MLTEVTADRDRHHVASPFWWRLADNLFRRWWLFLLPIVVFGALGAVSASRTPELYRSSGTLNAASNPLVPEPAVSGLSREGFETTADAVSRVINERLRTDAFILDVAERAGLTEAVETGALELDILRTNIWSSVQGSSTLTVNAQWEDPQTAFELVAATIGAYSSYLSDTVASDAAEAEEFYSTQLTDLEAERSAIESEYDDYVSQLPALERDEEYPFNVQIAIQRLQTRLDATNVVISSTRQDLDAARLTQVQLKTEAGRSFATIDEPRLPTSPESVRGTQLTRLVSFLMLGVIIATVALLVTTVLDRTVTSAADLAGVAGITVIATVPPFSGRKFRRANRTWRTS